MASSRSPAKTKLTRVKPTAAVRLVCPFCSGEDKRPFRVFTTFGALRRHLQVMHPDHFMFVGCVSDKVYFAKPAEGQTISDALAAMADDSDDRSALEVAATAAP